MSKKHYDVVERTDAFGTTLWIRWNDVRTALKLQELVNEKIKDMKTNVRDYELEMSLQCLVSESQDTDKEKGNGGKS